MSSQSLSEQNGSDRRRLNVILVCGSVVTIVGVYFYFTSVWDNFHEFNKSFGRFSEPFFDFVYYYYEMGKDIFVTKRPVYGYLYSPVFAMALWLFAQMNLEMSTVVWVGLLILTNAGLFYVSYKLIMETKRIVMVPFLLFFVTCYPVIENFRWGQISTLVTLLVIGSLFTYMSNRRILSAALLAVAVAVKYYLGMFALIFVLRKDTKFLVTFALIFFVLTLVVPVAAMGWHATFEFYGRTVQALQPFMRGEHNPNAQYFPNFVVRILPDTGKPNIVAKLIFMVIGLLIVEMNLLVVYNVIKHDIRNSMVWSFVLMFLSIPFFTPPSWPHYFVYLPFCQLFLYKTIVHEGRKIKLFVGMLNISVVCSSIFLFNYVGNWMVYNSIGFVFISNLLLLMICYLELLPMTIFREKMNISSIFHRLN